MGANLSKRRELLSPGVAFRGTFHFLKLYFREFNRGFCRLIYILRWDITDLPVFIKLLDILISASIGGAYDGFLRLSSPYWGVVLRWGFRN